MVFPDTILMPFDYPLISISSISLPNLYLNLKNIEHLKQTFIAGKPPQPDIVYQDMLMAAESLAKYLS